MESQEQLEERIDRIEVANAIAKLGVELNWRVYSLAELKDIKVRLILAERLRNLGKIVQWQEHLLSQLAAMETELLGLKISHSKLV